MQEQRVPSQEWGGQGSIKEWRKGQGLKYLGESLGLI